jgi:hypothetical protein
MDCYLYSVPSFIIGLAAGFQAIIERYEKEATLAVFTPPAIFYLLTRGLFATVLFIVLWHLNYIVQPTLPGVYLLLYSVGCGAVEEAIVRTRISLIGVGKPNINEEFLRGPFDLVKKYQDFFLTETGKFIPGKRLRYVYRFIPRGISFKSLCERIQSNLPALTDSDVKNRIKEGLVNLKQRYKNEANRGADTSVLERRYQVEVAFLIYDSAGGKENLKTLLLDPE